MFPLYLLVESHAGMMHSSNPILPILAVIFPILLALINIYVGKMEWLNKIIPEFRWISLGAGVSIAYVFLDILPELSTAQMEIEESGLMWLTFWEKHAYLLALVGLALFYGLELLADNSRKANLQASGEDCTSQGVFWVHIGAFAFYNALIGELLSNTEEKGLVPAILLSVALTLHFLINDRSLREHHKKPYDKIGRWVLAGALIAGWVIGSAFHLPEAFLAVLWGLVAGGLILNVLKEELPDSKESCFPSFIMGAGIYAILLLSI
ncbi:MULTISPECIES: hypothetical protein [Spirulina sp. CCY15215]|uniref:hypothetical protein n=1 Tax=Spirulina sp. CCY15215 TaxID=2767591 RepID=UPI00194FE1E4|nr:hypothetical protein [Spirulina major]